METAAADPGVRVGLGWDVHRLATGRPLMLAGVQVPYPKGLLGHSDGDVVLHAIIDAMLGAAGLDDIGQIFPDTDPALKNVPGRALASLAVDLIAKAGWRAFQVDAVVVLENPKLAPCKARLRESLAQIFGLPVERANVKAKTAERMGEIGLGEAVACHAVALLVPAPAPRAQLV